ncbi:MAG: Fe-S cluster assembly protein HesB [Candidatus Woesearchaeota archaeon]
MTRISHDKIAVFQNKIFRHYKQEGRNLPWRHTTDRYKVMVSEIMLQQTQVSRVIEKYIEWMREFPTPKALADASLSDVLKLWKGLGYNNRAKRLQDSARIILNEYDGVVPDTVEELIKLPGIGPYTARSILIFADNKDIATVDTNIRRLLIAEFGIAEDTSDRDLFELAQRLLPTGRSRDWHNALMDYGAMVLTSRKSGIKPKSTQSKFKGSRRQYRAKLLHRIVENGELSLAEAREEYGDSPAPVSEILGELESDGLVKQEAVNNKKKGSVYRPA